MSWAIWPMFSVPVSSHGPHQAAVAPARDAAGLHRRRAPAVEVGGGRDHALAVGARAVLVAQGRHGLVVGHRRVERLAAQLRRQREQGRVETAATVLVDLPVQGPARAGRQAVEVSAVAGEKVDERVLRVGAGRGGGGGKTEGGDRDLRGGSAGEGGPEDQQREEKPDLQG
ncbi:MAG: hypothetical protein Q8T11_11550 [Elusimicrobiota bacterium]|nr:hypothetical protein [Elusimicrobiota bacterium]